MMAALRLQYGVALNLGLPREAVEALVLPPQKRPSDPMAQYGYFAVRLNSGTAAERSVLFRHYKAVSARRRLNLAARFIKLAVPGSPCETVTLD